jgi:DNA-binding CsgD family transcriptional regulator
MGSRVLLTFACGGGMNQLTHQEQKIAALVAQGLTNKEIAQRLSLSVFTVRNQVQVIMRKLELKNRIQVAYLFGQQTNITEIAVYQGSNVRDAILLSGIAKLQKIPARIVLLPKSGHKIAGFYWTSSQKLARLNTVAVSLLPVTIKSY